MSSNCAFSHARQLIWIGVGVISIISGCAHHLEVPAEYEIQTIKYPKDWKPWDYRHEHIQITEKARLSFNYSTSRRWVLTDQAKLTPPQPTDSFGIALLLIRCSEAAGRGYIYGCVENRKSPWDSAPPIDPVAEGIAWDMNVRVIDRETGKPLPSRIDRGCDLTKFCNVIVDFSNPAYRPEVEINLGTVFVGGKAFPTPTLVFRRRDAYLRWH